MRETPTMPGRELRRIFVRASRGAVFVGASGCQESRSGTCRSEKRMHQPPSYPSSDGLPGGLSLPGMLGAVPGSPGQAGRRRRRGERGGHSGTRRSFYERGSPAPDPSSDGLTGVSSVAGMSVAAPGSPGQAGRRRRWGGRESFSGTRRSFYERGSPAPQPVIRRLDRRTQPAGRAGRRPWIARSSRAKTEKGDA